MTYKQTILGELQELAAFGVQSARLTLFIVDASGLVGTRSAEDFASDLSEACNSNDSVALYFAASYLASNAEAEAELSAAFEIYLRSAENGFPPAQNMVSAAYQFGRGTAANAIKALEWAQRAASAGFIPAQLNLATLYRQGDCATKDLSQSFYWYMEAAKQGSADGAHGVATMYEAGEGVDRDATSALAWYRKAGEKGSWMAHGALASVYRLGRLGQPMNPHLALTYEQSSERLKRIHITRFGPV